MYHGYSGRLSRVHKTENVQLNAFYCDDASRTKTWYQWHFLDRSCFVKSTQWHETLLSLSASWSASCRLLAIRGWSSTSDAHLPFPSLHLTSFQRRTPKPGRSHVVRYTDSVKRERSNLFLSAIANAFPVCADLVWSCGKISLGTNISCTLARGWDLVWFG